mgnify:CR=1 FL=1
MSGTLTSLVNTILLRPNRSIGTIIPGVVVEEAHRDDLVITDHPVEQGAAITDHAFKRPAEVVLRCGWSNSDILSAVENGSLFGAVTESYVKEVYAQLLELQESRTPFSITTGKRTYSNMLIASLSTSTDRTTEYSLFVTAVCRQIIIVETQVATMSPAENQANPASTAATKDTGVRSATEVTDGRRTSVLKSLSSWLGG